MGQYHKLVAPELRQYVMPHRLGAGLNAREQVAGALVPAALAALLVVDPTAAQADLPGFPGRGRWAGQRIFAIGDYAQDDDLPGWAGPALSRLYALCREEDSEPKLEAYENHLPAQRDALFFEARRKWQELSEIGFLDNISSQVEGLVEFARNGRFAGNGVRDFLPVKHAHGRWSLDCDVKTKEWIARRGYPREAWARPAAGAPTPTFASAMAQTGPERVIACLDRQEFLDPQAFGEPATLAGIVCGSEGSAAAALAQLFHPRCRGGGDLSEFARAGGWRNGRLIVSSPEPSAAGLPTTAEIRSRFTDISKPMKRFLKKEFG